MKNENKNAMPMAYGETDFCVDGLTKLEYASIQILSGLASDGWIQNKKGAVKAAVIMAKMLFDELEDDSTTVVSDTEL